MLELIVQLISHISVLERNVSIQIAELAYHIGADELVFEFLPLIPENISDQHWLEVGLELSFQLDDNARVDLFYSRLAELFPKSVRLEENRDRRLLLSCQIINSDKIRMRLSTIGFTDFHFSLMGSLSIDSPEYDEIIAGYSTAKPEDIELVRVCCTIHALNANNPIYAAQAIYQVTKSMLYGRQATQILLRAIKAMMLVECPPDGREDNYRIYFREVFRFISLHPTDHEIRLRLQDLLSVETCGELGIPIVALTMMDLSSEGVRLVNSSVNSNSNSNSNSNFEDGISKTLENGLYWLASLGSGEPGVTVLPSQLLAADPDSVVSTIENFVDLASGLGGEQIDLNFMEQLVLLACSITPHATQKKNSDIPLIRHLASNMAIHGNYQKARNLAEQVLLLGRQDNYRLRLAWHSYGDIYHRCHNYPMALLGLAWLVLRLLMLK